MKRLASLLAGISGMFAVGRHPLMTIEDSLHTSKRTERVKVSHSKKDRAERRRKKLQRRAA